MNRLRILTAVSIGSLLLAASGCGSGSDLGQVANAAKVAEIRAALGGDVATGDSAAPASTGVGWASLRGRFVLDGSPPQLKPKTGVNKDTAVCAPGGNAPVDPTLVVASDGGIANVAIYLRRASRVHETAT